MVVKALFGLAGSFFDFVPNRFHPDNIFGTHIPGLAVIFTLIIILIAGILTRNYIGKKLVSYGDHIIARIPLVSTIYQGIKQLIESIFTQEARHFRRVVLVEWPRKGVYAVAFVTQENDGELQKKTQQKTIGIFLPTSPNPTTGYYFLVPEEETVPLDISIEDAFKLILSAGILTPPEGK
ncbi:MAG: DUF502 domain-containing protein [Deltaproteobacteria bacterium]|nr:MAG: DUF502 domain-containing protein [Deltaproteobacteria bacterium]